MLILTEVEAFFFPFIFQRNSSLFFFHIFNICGKISLLVFNDMLFSTWIQFLRQNINSWSSTVRVVKQMFGLVLILRSGFACYKV